MAGLASTALDDVVCSTKVSVIHTLEVESAKVPIAPDVDSRSDVVIGGSDCIDELAVNPSPAE